MVICQQCQKWAMGYMEIDGEWVMWYCPCCRTSMDKNGFSTVRAYCEHRPYPIPVKAKRDINWPWVLMGIWAIIVVTMFLARVWGLW